MTDVIGIGNAIVDQLCFKDDAFLAQNGLAKGGMALINQREMEELKRAAGEVTHCAGGSVANTLAGIGLLGGSARFIGKVAADAEGEAFIASLREAGVDTLMTPVAGELSTGQCLIFVTPDAQRTMQTHLGICGQITKDDIAAESLRGGKILFAEGYLFDEYPAREAVFHAATLAKKQGAQVAFTLSDAGCVERHLGAMQTFAEETVDVLFANELELKALYGVGTLEELIEKAQQRRGVTALTRGEEGSLIITPEKTITIRPWLAGEVEDTTGAGDLYAAGFLHGYTQGWALQRCGDLASRCAGTIIAIPGARPHQPLKPLIEDLPAAA